MENLTLQNELLAEDIRQNKSKQDTTICDLIADQAANSPDRTAIVDGETRIDFQSLQKRASEYAGALHSRSVPSGSLVGVCMKRGWELVAALLGTMQAGCAYVPLDPAYPKSRIRYMLEHSGAVAAFVDEKDTADMCQGVQELIWSQEIGKHVNQSIKANTKDLAYVIYTSGSTGRPKGVAIEHRSIVVMRQSMNEMFSAEELERVLAAASVCFDTSVMEIFGTLSLGGSIVLADNALQINQLPAVDEIKTCVMVASAVQALLSSEKLPESLKCLVFGGEALKQSLVEQVHKKHPDLRILNAYGPTEDTVYSTIAEIARGSKITIGKSVPLCNAYILDEHMQPVSAGVAGELYLAGSKLARGYLNDEEMTKTRFIERAPTDTIPDTRLYKTGDLCQWTGDGEIEFIGRVDQQVKVRGYRIELREIESTLESIPSVDAAAVTVIKGGTGQQMLVAFIVLEENTILTDVEIKDFLANSLPKYMVPQLIRYLPALPQLPNDKLDRNKLSTLAMNAEIISEKQAAEKDQKPVLQKENQSLLLTDIQKEVASLLNIKDPGKVTPQITFEALGLDSLTVLELSGRLTKLFHLKISPQDIYEHASPEALVRFLTGQEPQLVNNGGEAHLADTLSGFQTHIQSSHPTFQAAKASAWNANDKSKLVQEVLQMVNDDRRNPYSKVLRTGSATRGVVGDAYNEEEQESIIWTTNLYLGLNRDEEVIKEAATALVNFGTGMGTSAAASGMTDQHLAFEEEFADLVGKPSACLFPTGYTANVGAVAGILGRNDVVVIDQLCHASIVDGARLCGATVRTFKHNDTSSLEAVLQSEMSPYRTIMVVLEGVYSMGEGAAPVAKIVATAKKYQALVLVDEAHSFGFYGKGGAGICAEQGVTEDVDFIMTTLSKAMGSLGGVVAASREHVNLMKSSSRAYIFQASVSPADMAAALTALRRLRSDDSLRDRLWDTTRYMRRKFTEAGYDLGMGDGPIVTPHFSDKNKLYGIVQNLYQRGIQTSAVTYPIVEVGRGRLRLICSAAHTRADVDQTLEALILAEKEVDEHLASRNTEVKRSPVSPDEIKQWVEKFRDYLKEWIKQQKVDTPDLVILVDTPEAVQPFGICVENNEVSFKLVEISDLPCCHLTLKGNSATIALQSSDVQGLLRCISNGICLLKGQVEPFVWLIARIVEQRHLNKQIVSSKH